MKFKIRSWGSAVVLATTAGLILANAPAAFAATKIDLSNHWGQSNPSGVYEPGNVTTYQEGDSINFQFTIEATDAALGATGTMNIEFTGQETQCDFFEQEFTLGTHDSSNPDVVTSSGTPPIVTTVGTPLAGTGPPGPTSDEWIQTLSVVFPGNGEATVYYFLTLTDEAGECNGSSQHSRIGATTGHFQNPGTQNVPVPANSIVQTGMLEVVKVLDPPGDPGEFDLQINGVTDPDADDVGDGGSTDEESVPTGTNTVGEEAGSGTDLDDYDTEISCVDQDGRGTEVAQSSDAGPLNVTVGSGDDIVCTITNTRKTGELEVRKDLVPDSDTGKFDLQIDGVTDPDADDVGDGGSTNAETVNTGIHTVGEVAGAGTDLNDYDISIECQDDQGATVAGPQAGSGPLDVDVAEDDDIVCTVTNVLKGTPVGELEVVKDLIPSNNSGKFDLLIEDSGGTPQDAATDVGDGGTTGVNSLTPGDYDVSEAAGTGTDLSDYNSSIACVDQANGNAPAGSSSNAGPLTVTVADGSDILCTITNTRRSGGGGVGGGGVTGGGGGDTVVTAAETCLDLVPTILGTAGNTLINGTPGDDVIIDLTGNNTVRGNGGNDVICTGPGNDNIATGDGNDLVIDFGGVNRIHVAGGNDTIDAQGDNVIFGGPGADRIKVYDGKNRIRTFSGGDRVRAGNGDNFIRTGGGRDRVFTGNGDNDIGTHHGRDRVRTGSGDDFIRLNKGNDVGRAGKGDNTIRGGKKHDRMIAGNGDDHLDGMNGTDTCRPGGGNNTLKSCEK